MIFFDKNVFRTWSFQPCKGSSNQEIPDPEPKQFDQKQSVQRVSLIDTLTLMIPKHISLEYSGANPAGQNISSDIGILFQIHLVSDCPRDRPCRTPKGTCCRYSNHHHPHQDPHDPHHHPHDLHLTPCLKIFNILFLLLIPPSPPFSLCDSALSPPFSSSTSSPPS